MYLFSSSTGMYIKFRLTGTSTHRAEYDLYIDYIYNKKETAFQETVRQQLPVNRISFIRAIKLIVFAPCMIDLNRFSRKFDCTMPKIAVLNNPHRQREAV